MADILADARELVVNHGQAGLLSIRFLLAVQFTRRACANLRGTEPPTPLMGRDLARPCAD